MFYHDRQRSIYDFNYISYTLPFYLIASAGYMLKKKKLWNTMVNVIFKQKFCFV